MVWMLYSSSTMLVVDALSALTAQGQEQGLKFKLKARFVRMMSASGAAGNLAGGMVRQAATDTQPLLPMLASQPNTGSRRRTWEEAVAILILVQQRLRHGPSSGGRHGDWLSLAADGGVNGGGVAASRNEVHAGRVARAQQDIERDRQVSAEGPVNGSKAGAAGSGSWRRRDSLCQHVAAGGHWGSRRCG